MLARMAFKILLATCASSGFGMNLSHAQDQPEKVSRGIVEIERTKHNLLRLLDGGKMRCNKEDRTFKFRISDYTETEGEEETLKKVTQEAGIDISIDFKLLSLTKKVNLVQEIVSKYGIRTKRAEGLSTDYERKPKRLSCFHQEGMVEAERETIRFRVSKARQPRGRSHKSEEFSLSRDTDVSLIIRHRFDEDCFQCWPESAVSLVTGREGNRFELSITHIDGDIYVIPLFWNKNGKTVDIKEYLPPDVHKAWISTISKPGEEGGGTNSTSSVELIAGIRPNARDSVRY